MAIKQKLHAWFSSPWFKIGLSLVLLGILLAKTNITQLSDAVKKADTEWVIAAYLCYLGSQVVSAFRWRSLARPLGFDEPYGRFFTSFFTGMYMNLFAPSTVAGDIGRALLLAGTQKRKALAFTTVIADRGLGFVVLSWIGAFAIFTQPRYQLPALLYYAAWTVPPGTLLAWLYGPKLAVRALAPENHWRQLVERDLAPYWHDRWLLIQTSLVACVFHTMQIVSQIFLAWALGLKVSLSYFFIFVPVVNIIGMAPITFSGIGLREIFYRFFLKKVAVASHTAVALGLLSSVVVLLTGVAGGVVFLLSKAPPPGISNSPAAAADDPA